MCKSHTHSYTHIYIHTHTYTTNREKDKFGRVQMVLTSDALLFQNNLLFYQLLPLQGKILNPTFWENIKNSNHSSLYKGWKSTIYDLFGLFSLSGMSVLCVRVIMWAMRCFKKRKIIQMQHYQRILIKIKYCFQKE